MTRTVAVPIWLLALILLLAGASFLLHFLVPSVRWFLRRRMEHAVARLNARLKRPIAPFKLARRFDTVQRLIYDPAVTRAVAEEARAQGIPEAVAFARARAFAREIVPGFSAFTYFAVGARVARWLSRALYRVRLSDVDLAALDRLPQDAGVVFVMNHRSNMDYVLVTWIAAGQGTLSYAVGEWARVWPLSALIRAMGAYFIRRRDRSPLYRAVLARYVQMATAAGETQAMFPEGRLSLDGRMGEPRLGLLSYIADGFAEAGRDVVFVPVALGYDRVLEDRFLIRARLTGTRRFRPPLLDVLGALAHHLGQRLTFRFRGFGTARVNLGPALSLGEFLQGAPADPVPALAAELMGRVARAVPVTPVPLVARCLLDGRARPRAALEREVAADLATLAARGVTVPRRGAALVVADALGLLAERGVIVEAGGTVARRAEEAEIFAFYAAGIEHHFAPAPAPDPAPGAPELYQLVKS